MVVVFNEHVRRLAALALDCLLYNSLVLLLVEFCDWSWRYLFSSTSTDTSALVRVSDELRLVLEVLWVGHRVERDC